MQQCNNNIAFCLLELYKGAMKATRFPFAPGFTLVEVLAALAILAAIGAIGVVAVTNAKTSADSRKLASDVASINRSVQIFRSNGGNLTGLSWAESPTGSHKNAVLNQLKARASSSILGVTSSVLDARVYATYQTSAEAATSSPRAVWVTNNATDFRVQVVTSGGIGVKEFYLDEDQAASDTITANSRGAVKTTSSSSDEHWVWDRVDPTPTPPQIASAEPPTGVADTGGADMQQLGLDTGSWRVDPNGNGRVTIGYGYREAGYASRLALFDLTGMGIYDLTTDAGRKAFMLEAMRRILAGGTEGHVIIDASTTTPGSSSNTYTFNPGAELGALLIPNTDLKTAMDNLAKDNRTLADYAAANPQTSPLVSVAKYGTDIPSFYSKQFAKLGTSNTYAVEDMVTTTSTTADYQDMVFTTSGMTSTGTMNSIANPADFYTNAAMGTMNPSWTWSQTTVGGITENSLHSYLSSVGVVP